MVQRRHENVPRILSRSGKEGGLIVFFKKKQQNKMGYPVCDHLNNALRILLQAPFVDEYAISEICWAIKKTGGYFKADVKQMLSDEGIWDFKNGRNKHGAVDKEKVGIVLPVEE